MQHASLIYQVVQGDVMFLEQNSDVGLGSRSWCLFPCNMLLSPSFSTHRLARTEAKGFWETFAKELAGSQKEGRQKQYALRYLVKVGAPNGWELEFSRPGLFSMIGDSDERNMCYRHMYQRADIVDGQDSVLETLRHRRFTHHHLYGLLKKNAGEKLTEWELQPGRYSKCD